MWLFEGRHTDCAAAATVAVPDSPGRRQRLLMSVSVCLFVCFK